MNLRNLKLFLFDLNKRNYWIFYVLRLYEDATLRFTVFSDSIILRLECRRRSLVSRSKEFYWFCNQWNSRLLLRAANITPLSFVWVALEYFLSSSSPHKWNRLLIIFLGINAGECHWKVLVDELYCAKRYSRRITRVCFCKYYYAYLTLQYRGLECTAGIMHFS